MSFDALREPLSGRRLIEASAGTGKTWTIAWLFVRWIVERDVAVDRLLVVTFTEAAAEELRHRLRKRLGLALRAIDDDTVTEDRANEAAAGWRDTIGADVARARLGKALQDFDRALITTIHGFCFRALSERAFEAGQDFDAELGASSRAVVRQAAREAWGRVMRAAPEPLVTALAGKAALVESVVRQVVGAQPVRVLPPPGDWGLDGPLAAVAAARPAAAAAWAAGGRACALSLPARPELNKTKFNANTVASDVLAMDRWLAAGGPMPPAEIVRRMTRFTPDGVVAGTKAKQVPPDVDELGDLAPLIEAGAAAWQALAAAIPRALRAVVDVARDAWERARPTPSTVWFDDLLVRLAAALQREPGLAATLREQLPVALIDEFQDTDPVQWSIFSSIYPSVDHNLALIGDPKQAIYRFRGADLPTYLAARASAAAVANLPRNFRSDGALVDALAGVFTARDDTFRDPSIRWTPVDAQRPGSALAGPVGWCCPVQVLRAEQEPEAAVASDVVAALQAGVRIDGAPLRPGDLAVLVSTHAEGEAVLRALAARGVPAVRAGNDPVWRTPTAADLGLVLDAILAPSDPARLRAALATELIGADAETLAGLDADEAAMSGWLDQLAAWRQVWEERGIARLARDVVARVGLDVLVGRSGGERTVTNLRQLVELASRAEAEAKLGPLGLRRWLRTQSQSEEGDEDAALRLESDASAVRVVTLHASKGLEYGVVWILGLGKWGRAEAVPRFHDGAGVVLDLCAEEASKAASEEELRAERMRLAYVGLTRARHAVLAVAGPSPDEDGGPLGHLLGGAWPPAAPIAPADAPTPVVCREISVTGARWWPSEAPPPVRAARKPSRVFLPDARLSSFSALVRLAEDGLEHEPDRAVGGGGGTLPLATFPRGAEAGTAVHAVLEEVPPAELLGPKGLEVATAQLARHGIDPSPWAAPLLAGLDEVVRTPILEDGTRLIDVAASDRVDELEFALSVAGRVSVRELAHDVAAHGGPEVAGYAARMRRIDARLDDAVLQGFIDLVFRAGERYYVVDYKTNHLGDGPDDYRAPSLAWAMSHGDYILQAALYTLAVHRHLRARVPGYDYDRHVGGVRYLFLRGMRPETGMSAGVYTMRPSRAWIEGWDRALGGGR